VLQTRELIKIKFREFKDEKVALSKSIAELTHSEVVGIIGHTLILFRQNPDSEKQQIHFPAKK
jgi:RNA-binding protein YhbY